jgi:hypothetical protein
MHDSPVTAATSSQHSFEGTALNALRLSSNTERVLFYHAAMGSPPVVTLTKALRAGILPTLPITAEMLTKTPPHTLATAEGHLDAHRQGIQSTQPTTVKHQSKPVLDNECSFPAVDTAKTPGARIVVKFYKAKDEIAIGPTGRLPNYTEWGGDYHVVFYHYDGNYIHVEFTKEYEQEGARRGIAPRACILYRPRHGRLLCATG